MLSCLVAIVAFHEHKMHNLIKHKLIPGLRAAGQPVMHGVFIWSVRFSSPG